MEKETRSSKSQRWRRKGSKTNVLKIKSRVSSFRRQWSFTDIKPEHHTEKTMYTSNRQPLCDHIFAPTIIVNNTSSNVGGSRGSSSQRVSPRRQCIHPSGSTSSCRIDQQPSFVGTESYCPVRKRSAKLVLVRRQARNVRLTKQYSSSESMPEHIEKQIDGLLGFSHVLFNGLDNRNHNGKRESLIIYMEWLVEKVCEGSEDDQAIQTILLGLPEDVYAVVDSCETAKEIWEHVRQMMKGSDIGEQEKKAKLFNE
nr:ribonuclease H-like domain-containing protein [Tanacetum cinerariifolium]